MGARQEQRTRVRTTQLPHRSVGKSVEKVDVREKVSGRARYEMDLERDGMLHAAVLRTNRPHARIVSVDTSAAEAMEGVEAAVSRTDMMGLFDDHVRHYGDAIAAVAAEDERTAREAVTAIDYELEELEAVYDVHDALGPDAPTIHPNNPNLKQHGRHEFTVENDDYVSNLDDYHSLSVGDVEAGFEEADFVHEGEYSSPRVNHCNLGTHCCLAEWEGETLVITETLASPGRSQEELAHFFGMTEDQVRIQTPPTVTSSFGGKSLRKLSLEPVAATLSRETSRPVKLWFDREEEFVATENRHRTHYTIKTGVTAEGKLTAVKLDVVADTGGYPNGVGHIVLSNSRDRPLDIYRIPNYEYEGVSAFTNNPPSGEYRGIGSTQLAYALESHLDEVAIQAGLDPFEFRRQNFVCEGDERPHTGHPIESCGIRECVDRGFERFEQLRRGETDDPTKVRGWGWASGSHTTASGAFDKDSSEARLELHGDGTLTAHTASIDNGQGSDTVMAQIICEETGIPIPDIDILRFPTTDELDDVLGAVASRSTYIIGAAVRDAAEELEAVLVERAVGRYGVAEEDVALDDGAVHVAGEGEVAIGDLLTSADDGVLTVYGSAESALTPPSYGADFAEVEVDVETGKIDVLTFVAAQDVGYAINPKMVEGQLEGAIGHSTEFALFSELKLDDGAPLNANLADYPAISPHEMPDTLACEIIESNEETGPYGAKGIGTPSMPPVAPALLNAVRNATGVRFRDPPVDTEEMFLALQEEGER